MCNVPIRLFSRQPFTAQKKAFLQRIRAFTLIELLTVIAIIGILSAIVIASVGKARQMARQTQNVSNLRTIGVACLTYANDNRGRLPISTYDLAGRNPRLTSGANCNMAAMPVWLLSPKWGGAGNVDYLPSADVFYGPFTPKLGPREPGKFFKAPPSTYRIGYFFYSFPSSVDSQNRDPMAYGLATDRIDSAKANMRTPLFSDIFGTGEIEVSGFNGPRFTVLHLDGSVNTFSNKEIANAGGSTAAIYVMAGIKR